MFGELINQNSFIVACYIVTALYVGFANNLLSDKIKNVLNNEITKLILLALIILLGQHSIELSIAFTIVVLVSLLNSKSKENFLNETFMDTDDNKEDMYKDAKDDSNEDEDEDENEDEKEDVNDNTNDSNDDTNDYNDDTNDSNENMNDNKDKLSCPPGCQPIPQNDDSMKSNPEDNNLTDNTIENFDVFNKESLLNQTIHNYKHNY